MRHGNQRQAVERRFVANADVRAKDDGHITGHMAVFNQDYVLYEGDSYRVVERVKPTAFDRALEEKHDVRCCFNHDGNQLLGRTSAGTMTLKKDDQGLYFDTTPPETQLGKDIRTLIARKDITGCSFMFTVTGETIREEKVGNKTIRTREIDDVELYEGGPVTWPAYTGTDVSAASLRNLFPEGIPAGLRRLKPELVIDRDDDVEMDCRCGCRACYSAECDECEMHMATCGDEENCDHSMDDGSRSARDKVTKRVDSEDLPASSFIYVGDAQKPATWALPWKFKSEAKTKSHLRNALARFNQTAKIPADKKDACWKKLVRLCKKYDITVSDEESKAFNLTAEQRAQLRDTIGGGKDCQCDCPECLVGNCAECSEPDCVDDQCDHSGADGDDGDRGVILEMETRMRQAGIKPEPLQ